MSFRLLPRKKVDDLPLREIAGVPVLRAEIQEFSGVRNETLDPAAFRTVDASFGHLDRAQYEVLRTAFGRRSMVPYEKNRNYAVVDFLPPFVQALVNQDLEIPGAVDLAGSRGWNKRHPRENQRVSVSMNCHATAYETIRAIQRDVDEVNVFFGDMTVMQTLTRSNKFRPLATFRGANATTKANLVTKASAWLAAQTLKPGDLVQFVEVSPRPRACMLLHSTVHVGAGLFFDKPNTEEVDEDSPFRLATADLIAATVAKAVGDSTFKIEVFRPIKSLDPPEIVFEAGFRKERRKLEKVSHRMIGPPLVVEIDDELSNGGIKEERMSAMISVPLIHRRDGLACVPSAPLPFGSNAARGSTRNSGRDSGRNSV